MNDDTPTAVGYTRLSQESDRSIEGQKEDIRSFAADHDLDLDIIYDDGRRSSGFDNERPEYQRMLDRISKDGDVDAIIVRDRARLSRDKHERQSVFSEMHGRGVDIYIQVSNERVSVEGDGFIMEAVHGYADDDKKREEIKKAKKEIRKRIDDPDCYHGEPPAGLTYADDKRGLIVDENNREEFERAVRAIEMKIRDDQSYTDIESATGLSRGRISRIMNKQRSIILSVLEVDDPDRFSELAP